MKRALLSAICIVITILTMLPGGVVSSSPGGFTAPPETNASSIPVWVAQDNAEAVSYGSDGTLPKIWPPEISTADKLAAAARLKKAKAAAAATAETKVMAQGSAITAAAITDPATGFMIPDYFGTANWANSPALTKFVDALPGLGPAAANALGQYIPVAVADTTTFVGSDYYEIAVVEYQEKMHTELPLTKLRGYVQLETPAILAKLAAQNPPVASRHVSVGGGKFAIDNPHYLGPAIVAIGALPGEAGRPVRIKFYNLLPTDADGNLFIPVDTTVMGAGMGPNGMDSYTQNRATLHLHGNNTVWISDGTPHQWITPANETTPYPEGVSVVDVPDMPTPEAGAMTFFYSNAMSARLMFYHDHAMGITRLNVYAGEAAGYVVTDVVEQDLIDGTNNSGVNPGLVRVLPDIGIPLIIQDKTFVNPATIGTTDPTWLDPLQNTFGTTPGTAHAGDLWYPHIYVPAQNPWDISGTNPYGRWMYGPWFYPPTANIDVGPVPNPYALPYPPGTMPGHIGDLDFWDNSAAPWEAPFMPGTPNPSMPGEAFMDTMLVNGTVYPYLDVDPKTYRFRILNAANDRFLNLSLYQANPGIVGSLTTTAGSGYTADPVVTIANAGGDTTGKGFTLYATADLEPGSPTLGQVSFTIRTVGSNYTLPPVITVTSADGNGSGASAIAVLYTAPTEVGMVPVTGTAWLPPFDASGVPDQAMAGPNWIQIGTEGGFMPAPVVIPSKPITWNTNPTTFNFGTVNGGSLILGTAERADVIVDFSAYAGKTLILYNDAPAAFPAPVPTYDYYTNDQDLTDIGGAPTTPPGVGPNTRTIMQIRVAAAPVAPAYNVAALNTVWAKGVAPSTKRGVFEVSQDPIIVPQQAYNSAYGKTGVGADTLPTAAFTQFVQVNQSSKTFQPISADGTLQAAVNLPIQPKGAHDEMGGVYDTGYGRMSGMMGLEIPATTSRVAQFIPIPYAAPPVDIIAGSIAGTLVGSLDDGTQIWNITHNGVDTHTIHTHLFNAQIISRVGWDGIMLPPAPNELGWKETFRMNPLEQITLGVRPILPTAAQVPFLNQVPNSVRPIDPTMPLGATLAEPPPAGWFDPNGVRIPSITNHLVNFGWEYVYHCHILAHEEMDMMHDVSFAVPPDPPANLSVVTGKTAVLTWQRPASLTLTGFIVQRALDAGFTNSVVSWNLGNVTTYTDTTFQRTQTYYYRVLAANTVGDTTLPGFPVVTAKSASSSVVTVIAPPPAAPSLTSPANASTVTTVTPKLVWNPSIRASSYIVQVSTSSNFSNISVNQTLSTTSYTVPAATLSWNTVYYWRVQASNGGGSSAWSAVRTFTTATVAPPAAPTGLFATATAISPTQINLSWNAVGTDQVQVWRRTLGNGYSLIATTAAGGTSYNNTGLAAATTYYYYVIAVNATGPSLRSNTATATTLPAAPVTMPAAPVLTFPLNGAQVPNTTPTLQWAASAGATSYTVQLSGASDPAFTTLKLNKRGMTTTSYQVELGKLTAGRTYYWRISATNAAGTSTWSATGSFSVQ